MSTPKYDQAAEFYIQFADRLMADPQSFWHPLRKFWVALLVDRLNGRVVLDIACAEGHFTRLLGDLGPVEVIGVDISPAMLQAAAERTTDPRLRFQLDDAQVLGSVPDASIDVTVSNLALMDIPDHRAVFHAVRRVLKPGGLFIFSLLHPCFESPFHEPDAPKFLLDDQGERTAYRIQAYSTEGHWQSGGNGVRGRVGAHHRTVSTLVNDLFSAGFALRGLHEPVTGAAGLHAEVPQVLLIEAQSIPALERRP